MSCMLEMGAAGFSETWISMCRTIRCIPEEVSFERTEIYSAFCNVLIFTTTTLDFTTTVLHFPTTKLDFSTTKLDFTTIKLDFTTIKLDFTTTTLDYTKKTLDVTTILNFTTTTLNFTTISVSWPDDSLYHDCSIFCIFVISHLLHPHNLNFLQRRPTIATKISHSSDKQPFIRTKSTCKLLFHIYLFSS